jgi:hypothetical protein
MPMSHFFPWGHTRKFGQCLTGTLKILTGFVIRTFTLLKNLFWLFTDYQRSLNDLCLSKRDKFVTYVMNLQGLFMPDTLTVSSPSCYLLNSSHLRL